VLILKGQYTKIAFGEETFVNTTGNAGLAKGGSGDALAGIIAALLAQGYSALDAAQCGIYLHGLAADIALKTQSLESMLITDVIECLGQAFNHVRS
jgi:NAD(P)H-hydrate epimerase